MKLPNPNSYAVICYNIPDVFITVYGVYSVYFRDPSDNRSFTIIDFISGYPCERYMPGFGISYDSDRMRIFTDRNKAIGECIQRLRDVYHALDSTFKSQISWVNNKIEDLEKLQLEKTE